MGFRLKNGKAFREAIAQKDTQCRYCKWQGKQGWDTYAQDPAHIVPRGHGGDDIVQNGIGLCRKHHDQWDKYETAMPWSMFYEDEKAYILRKKGKWWKKINWDN